MLHMLKYSSFNIVEAKYGGYSLVYTDGSKDRSRGEQVEQKWW